MCIRDSLSLEHPNRQQTAFARQSASGGRGTPDNRDQSAAAMTRRSLTSAAALAVSFALPAMISTLSGSPLSPLTRTRAPVWPWMTCMFRPRSPITAPRRLKP
eukprot:8377848-Alexandrium_andersonii.AAC.1